MKNMQAVIERIMFHEKKYGNPPDHMCYGMGHHLKKYLGIPEFISLNVLVDHGVWVENKPTQCQLKTAWPLFVHRESQRLELLRHSKTAYVMGSPFVHYRKLNKVEISSDAKGTVSFPIHSASLIDAVFGWQEYADQLAALPPQFHPITVCLFWRNLLEKRHEPFIKNNMQVVTAGHMADQEFAKNFYTILAGHKYSTSNMFGSFAFYSVEMGIPFFLYGERPLFNNYGGDHNHPSGIYDKFAVPENVRVAQYFTFSSLDGIRITPEIKDMCAEKLGLTSLIKKSELRRVILATWIQNLLITEVRRRIKLFIKKIFVVIFSEKGFLLTKNRFLGFWRNV